MEEHAPDDPPEVDQHQIGLLLRRIEAITDLDGWSTDGPNMCVYALYDHHDVVTHDYFQRLIGGIGRPHRTRRYTAQPMIRPHVFRSALPLQPWECLRNFALNVAYADVGSLAEVRQNMPDIMDAFRATMRQPGLIGFAACYETWHQKARSPEHGRALVKGDWYLGDDPRSREARNAVAVDIRDRVHRVERVRGDVPEVKLDVESRGDVPTSLRILVDTACDRLPPRNKFAARYPTLEDFITRGGR